MGRGNKLCYIYSCFFIILDALWNYPGGFNVTGTNSTAGVFATYPGDHLTIVNGFFDQVPFMNIDIICKT